MKTPWHPVPAISIALLAVLLAGCGRFGGGPAETKPGTSGDGSNEPQPTAVRPLVAACPTFAEAKAAIPDLVGGPEANDSPFKNMVLQCGYRFPDLDVQLRPAGVGILVFDVEDQGVQMWDSVRTDPGFPNATEISGLAEVAFATGTPGHNEVWVVHGKYALHMSGTRSAGIPLSQMVALARAMLAGLARVG